MCEGKCRSGLELVPVPAAGRDLWRGAQLTRRGGPSRNHDLCSQEAVGGHWETPFKGGLSSHTRGACDVASDSSRIVVPQALTAKERRAMQQDREQLTSALMAKLPELIVKVGVCGQLSQVDGVGECLGSGSTGSKTNDKVTH